MNINNKNETYEVVKKSDVRNNRIAKILLIVFVIVTLSYVTFTVYKISVKLSGMKISDDKVEYVYQKVGDLVNILNTKEDMGMKYNPTEKYDFKAPNSDEMVAEEPADVEQKKQILKEQLSRSNDSGKLMIIKDKLVDIFQKSKAQEDDLVKLKQQFYDTKAVINAWYGDRKNVKMTDEVQGPTKDDSGVVNRLKNNFSKFVDINKVNDDLNQQGGKKVLTIDQLPQMLSYAEVLLEAGSISQTIWILEDIQTLTKQQEILDFNKAAQAYIDKYPSPNIERQQIKELIDIIENRE